MDRFQSWLKLGYGKKLKAMHAWNAWLVVLLAVTGIMLYIPALRADIVGINIRVALKQLHIFLGILSVIIILLYLPLIGKHLKQIAGKRNQQFNLGFVLFLLVGWSITGIVLWFEKGLPKPWINYMLLLHDLFTWIGIPWAVYHSISRSRWLKKNAPRRETVVIDNGVTQSKGANGSAYTRRNFIRWAAGLGLIALFGPPFYRWLKRATDSGGAAANDLIAGDANRMLPPPEPMPASLIPIGGGSQGNFRVYTVTKIPSFTSEDWKFSINGLVKQPLHLGWDDFLKIPRVVQVSDFHCVTGWSVFKCTWEGIPLSALLDLAGVQNNAKHVKFYSGDGVYTDGLSLQQALMDDVMVAVMLDGKPIPQILGGPIRLIVPKMYAYKSVKWLQGVELVEQEHLGFWEVRGYDNDAWVLR